MFVEERILKKLIKQAYKAAGLVLVNTGEDYIIEGAYWAIQVQKEHLPKKIKAAIIELTGELPGNEEAFCATTNGNQQEFTQTVISAKQEFRRADIPFRKTQVIIEQGSVYARAYQYEKTGEIWIINDEISEAISVEHMDRDFETGIVGPFAIMGKKALLWSSETTTFMIFARYTEEESIQREIIEHLEKKELCEAS